MVGLKRHIENIKQTEGSELFITDEIQIVDADTKNEHYIDNRTVIDEEGLKVVKPISLHNEHYWYVCPACQTIHMTTRVGKQKPSCDNSIVKVGKFGDTWLSVEVEGFVLDAPVLYIG